MSLRRCVKLETALCYTSGEALGALEQRSTMAVSEVERGDYLVYPDARGFDIGYRVSRTEPSESGNSVVVVFIGGARVRFKAKTLVRVRPGVAW